MFLKIFLIATTFFSPFIQKDYTYNAELVSCNDSSKQIVLTIEQIDYKVKLFNLELKDEAFSFICTRLNETNNISIEVEKAVTIYNNDGSLNAYLFLDKVLLHKELIENDLASLGVLNPHYMYIKELQEASTKPVIGDIISEQPIINEAKTSIRGIITLILCIIIDIGLILFYIFFKIKLTKIKSL